MPRSGRAGGILVLLVLFVLPIHLAPGTRSLAAESGAEARPEPIPPALGGFIANLGQWDSPARFGIPGSGGAFGVDADGLSLWLIEEPADERGAYAHPDSRDRRGVHLRLEWRGASPERRLEGVDRLPGIRNYFAGNDPAQWRTRVPAYARVAGRGLYEGIDLVLREEGDRRVAYDLFLAPGADPSAVEIEVLGGEGLAIRPDGALAISTALGEVVQSAPRTWQTAPGGTRLPVACRFELRSTNVFGFALSPGRDPGLALVIDPTIDTFTYLGGSGHDAIRAIRIGSGDEPILAGHTQARDVIIPFPTTPGTFLDTMPVVGTLAFVTRLTSTADALVHSTFLGAAGTNQDASSVACAEVHPATQEVYVAGATTHAAYPTTPGAFDETFGPVVPFYYYESVFVTRLAADGTALIYSTFLGTDDDHDRPAGIVLHGDGRLTVLGTTWSAAFPTTPGSHRPLYPGGDRSAFLTQLSPDGSSLVFSTFVGGSGYDDAAALALASDGTFVLAGDTNSVDFPVTAGAYDTAMTAGAGEKEYILRMSASGDAVLAATFFQPLSLFAMILDAQDRPIIAGRSGLGFPLTANAYTQTPPADLNIALARLDAALAQLEYGTMIGGSLGGWGSDTAVALALHPSGTILIAGTTSSSDFPVTADAFQTTYSSQTDVGCFLWIDPEEAGAASLLHSTYLDGSDAVTPRAIALDSQDRVLIGGESSADDLAVTPTALQGVLLGWKDAFLARFHLSDELLRRGDVNSDGTMNVADAIALLGGLFAGSAIPCDDAADANDDGGLDVADAVSVLGALFVPGAVPPPAPGPVACGADPTNDALDCAGASGCP